MDEEPRYTTNRGQEVCGLCIENALMSYPGNDQEFFEVMDIVDKPVEQIGIWAKMPLGVAG